jgi:uncharacterized protein YprB with RNaseH-like and TPR domain/predicted nuclease with RNAse H fold/adenylate kinase family enzyme
MIERTFVHIPGVGTATEERLWQRGFRSWDQLYEALHSGLSIRDVLRLGPSTQRSLFPDLQRCEPDRRSLAWLDVLDQSVKALREHAYHFFIERLWPRDHWRLLASRIGEALYLDIETTGLSRDLHYMTVVGALYGGRFFQWVWPERLEDLGELIERAPLIVTFNGRRFDVPFLCSQAFLPAPPAHIDLLDVARAAGLTGGQKEVEKQLGLPRDREVADVDGPQAVALWCRALYGDGESYRRLLAYNRTDVEMLPQIAARLCDKLAEAVTNESAGTYATQRRPARIGRRPASFRDLRQTWFKRRAGLHQLLPRLVGTLGREQVVVGIDLRGNPANPTGWARCVGRRVDTRVAYDDDEILRLTRAAEPDLVSIDAPLSLPRGRKSVSDASPCRKTGGIVRDAERVLWARGIRVYPALIKHMQGLTQRGIGLATRLRNEDIPVIESYPGAAQDILGIVRKGDDADLLYRGLRQFGFALRGTKTHDELDAVTSALVGYFFLAGDYEPVGADDEGHLIIPRWTAAMRWKNEAEGAGITPLTVSLVGLPGAGKTTLCRSLAQRLGWRSFLLGEALRARAANDPELKRILDRGDLAPEPVAIGLVQEAACDAAGRGLIVDGFPRHPAQVELALKWFHPWVVLHLDIDIPTAARRIAGRLACPACGWVGVHSPADRSCPTCGTKALQSRPEDEPGVVTERLTQAASRLDALLQHLRGVRLIRLDASHPAEEVQEGAIAQLAHTPPRESGSHIS